MAEYRISGIWKNSEGITHYAVHLATKKPKGGYIISHAVKKTKSEAVVLLSIQGNTAKTLLWNYGRAQWLTGEDIHVVKGNPPFLRTNHDGILRDNLLHLINYGFVY